MAYVKQRYLNTDVHVYEQEDEEISLLQSDEKYPLSEFYSNDGEVSCITNCSYFTSKYVLGRNQGDLFNNTHDQEGFHDLVFTKDGKYHLGQFKSWDYKENVLAGLSVATVLIEDGKDASKVSTAIETNSKLTSKNPQTAVVVLKDGKVLLIVADGRTSANKGLTGYELRTFIKQNYDVELLCQLDGGGSSEMIVNGKIVNNPSDGKERPMFNGLALIKKKEATEQEDKDFIIKFPCKDGWDSQTFHSGHMAIDIGWLMKCSSNGKTPILACADGVVEYADYYDEVVSGKKVRPIVCILRHDELDPKYTYYSAYWHLSATPKNKGDVVKMGDEIGTRGNTGYSGGVHLHFVLMKCPKGTAMPSSYEFNKYAINPIPYIRVFDDQIFESKGNYDLKEYVKTDKPTEATEDIEVLKEEIELLSAQIKALESDKAKLEEEYSNHKNAAETTINRLTQKLEQVTACANKILEIAEV